MNRSSNHSGPKKEKFITDLVNRERNGSSVNGEERIRVPLGLGRVADIEGEA